MIQLPNVDTFLVPVDSQALLRMPVIAVLDILKMICEVIGDPQVDRKFDS